VEGINLWRKSAIAILRLVMASVLVLSLTSCGEKAISQEPYSVLPQKAQLSKQISEVSPPATIQELRLALEAYQPQVTIETPKQDEILQDTTATVRFQVKDLPLFQDPELQLGPHLHVIVDNEPYRAVYDLNQPLILSDLSPGTHTIRVFASRPWHESFKNEGAYAQSTFHIFTKTDDNNPDPTKPLLTYSRPKGSYGAEPILLDFYLTNAPLHLVAQDNPNDDIADWRIRCTINGESFVLDRWQPVYLKGFKPGKNWVQLEFLDEQGNPVKNVFNSTVRLITYEPKGKDTLSKIVRGELSADQVRRIVDSNYTAKTPIAEPTTTPTLAPTVEETPLIQPKEEKQPLPETEATPSPTLTPTVEETVPEVEKQPTPETQPEKPKSGGFFNRFQSRSGKMPTPQTTAEPSPTIPPTLPETAEEQGAGSSGSEPTPSIPPTLPEIIETPQPVVTPEAQATKELEKETPPLQEKRRFGGYFNRRPGKMATPQTTAEPAPSVPPTLPEIIETPQPVVTPETETTLPEKIAPQPEEPELKRYFSPRQYPNAAPSPTLPQTSPNVIEPPSLLETPPRETNDQDD
jgi:hypothetical protein